MRMYAEYHQLVEKSLSEQLRSIGEMPDILFHAMDYSLTAGGKRLRAVLLLASCEVAGGDVEKALPFACALEMIHTYSLIHDDLPAMDNDDLRRGKPTNHKVYGEAMAILAGDGLLSAAMELMMRHAALLAKNGDLTGIFAAEAIARHAGVTGMVAGQTMDVTGEGSMPTEDKVRYIHLHKTADLLTAPVEAGLLLAGADQKQVALGCEYGKHLGLAFQMVDDLLDVVGTAETLGKSIGKDAAENKLTWVAIRGIEGTREDAAAEIALAVDAAHRLNGDVNFLQTLAQSTLNRVQ
jgi:geranylgeranyl diphosphate synthase, type II